MASARTGLNWEQIGPALEQAAGAVGRLDSVVSRHPLRVAWLHRSCLTVTARLSALDGHPVDVSRVYGTLIDLPMKPIRDFGAHAHALGIARALMEASGEICWTATMDAVAGRDEGVGAAAIALATSPDGLPTIVAAALNLRDWLIAGGSGSTAYVGLIRSLCQSGTTVAPLPALAGIGMALGRSRLGATPSQWVESVCRSLAAEANIANRDIGDLFTRWMRWHGRLGVRRCSSRLPHLVALAAAMPVLCAAHVARVLGCSVRGASLMLSELAQLGIIVEASGRQSWKRYVTEEFSAVQAVVQRVGATRRMSTLAEAGGEEKGAMAPLRPLRPAVHLPPLEPPDLSDLLADTDRAIRKASAFLAAFAQRRQAR